MVLDEDELRELSDAELDALKNNLEIKIDELERSIQLLDWKKKHIYSAIVCDKIIQISEVKA